MAYSINEERFQASIRMLIEDAGYAGVPSFKHGRFAEEEKYKYQVYDNAREKLNYEFWTALEIGTGSILAHTKRAIEENRNLIDYRNKAIDESSGLKHVEQILFNLYRTDNDENTFNDVTGYLSGNADLVSYLFFLKNRDRYLPFRRQNFENRLSWMGIATSCSDYLSWENYQEFNEIIGRVQNALQPYFEEDVSLLDAHSFVWMQWHLKDQYRRMKPLCYDYSFGLVNISKDQWIQLIEDGTIGEKDIRYLAKFYAAPYHGISPTRLGELEGKSPTSYTSPCTSLAKRIKKKLEIPDIDRSSGKFKYYPICFLGRYDEDEHFEWQLRPELVHALEERCADQLETQFQHIYHLEEREAAEIPVSELIERAKGYHGGVAPVYTSSSQQRRRNALLVRAAKARANGKCQLCGETLDFNDQDGWPYLEAHHIVPLADDGLDDLSNMVALCPNCHRKMHVVGDQNDIAKLKEIAASH